MDQLSSREASPKPFVLVLMPFKREFDDIYYAGIKAACEKLHLHCERIDEQMVEGIVLEHIYNEIAKADILISDMSGQNANVFYETGYAHALGKSVILLTNSPKDIPFDLSPYAFVVYESGIRPLLEGLERRLQWWLDHPKDKSISSDIPIAVYAQGKSIEDNAEIMQPVFDSIHELELQIAVHNRSRRVIPSGTYQLGLLATGSYPGSSGFEADHQLPDGRKLYIFGKNADIFPEAWQTFKCMLQVVRFGVGDVHTFAVRLFTEIGPRDYTFKLRGAHPAFPASDLAIGTTAP